MRLTVALLLLAVVLLSLLAACADSHRYRERRKPIHSRRLSRREMGRRYYDRACRYPDHFNHKRKEREELPDDDDNDDDDDKKSGDGKASGHTCHNNLALPNGSFIGKFRCPFLPDEKPTWTKCCGYKREQFCCDPSYDDSWAHKRSLLMLCMSIGGVALAAVCLAALICVYCKFKKRARVAASVADLQGASKKPAPPTSAAPPPSTPRKVHPDADPNFGMENPNFGMENPNFGMENPNFGVGMPSRPAPPGYSDFAGADGFAMHPPLPESQPPAYSVDTV